MSIDLTMRLFHGEDDYRCLAAIFSASESADGLPMAFLEEDLKALLGEIPRFDLAHDLVVAEAAGQAVGFGFVQWWAEARRRTYRLSGFVPPEQRRRGIGQALLGWMEARARAMAVENAELPCFFRINATQFQAGLHALARQAGYGVEESWILMVRPSLEDIPDWPLPEGLEVRPALPEHYGDIWYATCEAYVPTGGPPPTRELPPDFVNSPLFQPDLWQVAWETSTGKVVGSVMTYINHAENQQMGILRGFTEGISTTPAWQRRGVARALIARSLKVQREAGMRESALVCSGEKPDNYRLYERCGFREVKRDTVYEKLVG